jgi:hypothetical protein
MNIGLVLNFQVIGFIRGPSSSDAIRAAHSVNTSSSNDHDDSLFSSSLSSSAHDTSGTLRTPAIQRRSVASITGTAAGSGRSYDHNNNSGPGRSPFVPYGATSPIPNDPNRHTSPLSSSTVNALSGLTSPSSNNESKRSAATSSKASLTPNVPVDMQFQPTFAHGMLSVHNTTSNDDRVCKYMECMWVWVGRVSQVPY